MGLTQAIQFSRVSGDGQEDGFSLEAQEALGKEYAKKSRLRIVKSWSEVESAYKERDRKRFFEMIEYVKKNKIKNVIFDKVDRAVRGFRSATVVEDLVEFYGVRFHFTRENLVIDSTSSPQDKFRFYLFAIIGKYYVDNLKQEQKKGVDQRIQAGHWSWKCPVGYHFVVDEKSGKKVVEPIAEQEEAIREIFKKYKTGNYSLPELIPILNKVTETEYGWKQLGKILDNPFYYGAMKIKGKIKPASHRGIVSKRLWDACQKMRGIRSEQYQTNPGKKNITKPFMQLLRCGKCDHQITGESHRKPSGKVYIYYRCANARCDQRKKAVSQENLRKQIAAAFEPFKAFKPVATEAFIATLRDRLRDVGELTSGKQGELEEAKAKLRERMAELRKLFEAGKVSAAEYNALLEGRRVELKQLDDDQVILENTKDKTCEYGLGVIELLPLLRDFFVLNDNLLSQAEIARMVLSNRLLEDATLRFSYANPFDVLLELVGGRGWWAQQDSNLRQAGYEPAALTN